MDRDRFLKEPAMVQPMPGDTKPECREADSSMKGERELVIPEIEETAEIGTRMVETGVVRITKHVHDVERTFHPTLHDQRVRVERVPVNRVIKNPPEVRTEGETTIIPIVEEVMVKLLLLKEEVRITRENVNKPAEPRDVTLRREEVIVEREPVAGGGTAREGPRPSSPPPPTPNPSIQDTPQAPLM
jgi:stress response protein YsnF